jgi:hypothetical protein
MSTHRAAILRLSIPAQPHLRDQQALHSARDVVRMDSDAVPSIVPQGDPDRLPGHGRYGLAY